jgi:hypothetical protein
VKFADSEDGIRSEFIKTPCGTRHTPWWDLIKTKEKSNYVAESKEISFYSGHSFDALYKNEDAKSEIYTLNA